MTRQHVSDRRDMFIANRLPVGADLKLKFVALWHVPLCIQKLRFRALWHVPLDIKNFLKVIRKRTEDNVIHVIAGALYDYTSELAELPVQSHDFH